jgi:hypothetical protein
MAVEFHNLLTFFSTHRFNTNKMLRVASQSCYFIDLRNPETGIFPFDALLSELSINIKPQHTYLDQEIPGVGDASHQGRTASK